MVSLLGDRRCSVDVLAWSTIFPVEVSSRVDDMDDRCCCETVLIGAVVPRHTAGREVHDWTTAVMHGGQPIALLARLDFIKNVGRYVGRRFDSTSSLSLISYRCHMHMI